MSRIVLCNPPAARTTMRDYYCSSTSKAGYAWHPIDLLAQAAWLKEKHVLCWRDFAVSPAGEAAALEIIVRDRPEVVLGLVGAAAPGDLAFWHRVHQQTGARVFLSGDLVRFQAKQAFDDYDFIEGVLLDFTGPGLRDHLAGSDYHAGLALAGDIAPHQESGAFGYPLPPHELVLNLSYRHPFLPRRFVTVMTDHGCPFRCAYCNSGRVPHRLRDEANLADELQWLAKHDLQSLFIKDMTFNADPERTLRVLEIMRRHGSWRFACYLRPDRIDDQLARALKSSGCVMAMTGVESGSEEILRQQRPGAGLARVEMGVRSLHRAKVPVGGHFLLGLPGENEDHIRETIALAKKLPLAYASFNLAAPRPGAPLDQPGQGVADGSSLHTRLLADGLDRSGLLALHRQAVRTFYLRPGYLLRRTWQVLRSGSLRRELRHGFALLRGLHQTE